MTKDYVIRARTKDVPLRAFAASTKEMVEQARRIHHLTPLTSAALGRVDVYKRQSLYIPPKT